MPIDPNAVLNDWQSKVIQNTANLSRAQREARGVAPVWDKYRAALGGLGDPYQDVRDVPGAIIPGGPNGPTPPAAAPGPRAPGQPGSWANTAGPPPTDPAKYRQWFQRTFGMNMQQYAKQNNLVYNPVNPDTAGAAWWGGPGQKAGAGRNTFGVGENPMQLVISQANSGDEGAYERARAALERQLGRPLSELELGIQFAGAEQYRRNLAGEGGSALPPWLRNVSMGGLHDPSSLLRLAGEYQQYKAAGRLKDWEKLQKQRAELVPDWAEAGRERFQELGFPELPVEYLWSPELNLSDPGSPLFGEGEAPASLHSLHLGQAGESQFLRSLTRDQLINNVLPMLWARDHRAAGSPSPWGNTGLTFGSPEYHTDPANLYQTGPGEYSGTFQRSPLMGWYGGGPQVIAPEAMRQAGFSAEQLAGTSGEARNAMLRSLGGGNYASWTGWGQPGNEGGGAYGAAPPTTPLAPGTPYPSVQAIQQAMAHAKTPEEREHYQQMLYLATWWNNPLYGIYGSNDPATRERYEELRGSGYGA